MRFALPFALLAAGVALAADPPDPDALPPGAVARLGSTRFHGEAAISPDGKRLVINNGLGVRVCEFPSLKFLRELPVLDIFDKPSRNVLYDVQFLDDRRLTGYDRNTEALIGAIFDVDTGKAIPRVLRSADGLAPGNRGGSTGIENLSADGTRFISLAELAPVEIDIWQTDPLKHLRKIAGEQHREAWAKLSADGSTLICRGFGQKREDGDKTPDAVRRFLQVFDAVTGEEKPRIHLGDTDTDATKHAVSPDGKRVATGCDRKTVRVFDTATGKKLFAIPDEGDRYDAVRFDRTGKRLLVVGDLVIRVYDAGTGKSIGKYEFPYTTGQSGRTAHRHRVEFPAGGKPVVFSPRGEGFEVWELETGKRLLPPTGHTERIMALRFTPDGTKLHSADQNSGHLVWDVAKRTANREMAKPFQPMWNVGRSGPNFNGDGTRCFQDPALSFALVGWDTADGKQLFRIEHPKEVVDWREIRFACGPDGFVVESHDVKGILDAPVSIDLPVRDLATGRPKVSVPLKGINGVRAAFTPDGKRLVTATPDRAARAVNCN